ncbi:helix-turn-helix transcriptional regulator [Haladaptatus sp. CMAA 1911]|uniref:helix-turn-helix transcriptional regulator n=1 Tax=unclassified Haladaptatus TaxID=2622732 RepID=UPI0037550CF9
MTTMDYRATNPLSGEELVVRDEINEAIDSNRLLVLRTIDSLSNPVTQIDITNEIDSIRQVVSTHLAVLQDRGFVNRDENKIELTAGGLLFLDAFDTCLEILSEEELGLLTRSDYLLPILEALTSEPYRVQEFQTALDEPPSDSTIRRALSDFVEKDWVGGGRGEYQITDTGRQVLSAYTDLAESLTQLIEKAPWFQRLPPENATVPIQALADAELTISNPSSPSSVLTTALALYDRKVDRFRGMSSIYNSLLFKTYNKIQQFNIGPNYEVIVDRPTFFKMLETTDFEYRVDDEDIDGDDPLVLDQSHTLGIGIYDERKVAIGAYNQFGRGQHIAMVVSTDDRIVEWAIDLYETYREQAKHPTELELAPY